MNIGNQLHVFKFVSVNQTIVFNAYRITHTFKCVRDYDLQYGKSYTSTIHQEATIEGYQLFNSFIVPIFLYGIEVWGDVYQSKSIYRIDKFFKRAFRFGYISECISFQDVIKKRDIHL